MVGNDSGRYPTFWVSIIAGVRTEGSLASYAMVVSCREFTIIQTSDRNVESVSWVKHFIPFRRNIQSKILRVTLIMHFQAPSKWEACGDQCTHQCTLIILVGIFAPKVSPQTDEPCIVRLPHQQSWFLYPFSSFTAPTKLFLYPNGIAGQDLV